MAISFSSNITLYSNVNFDTSYTDVRLFTSKDDCSAYFAGKTAISLTNQSWARFEDGFKINVSESFALNCNYLSYQNSGGRVIYCFITEVKYINSETTFVKGDVDVFCTYCTEYTVHDSLVIREHVKDDIPSKYTLKENVEIGHYLCQKYDKIDELLPLAICTLTNKNGKAFKFFMENEKDEIQDVTGEIVGKIYTCDELNVNMTADGANTFLTETVKESGAAAVSAVFMFPAVFLKNITRQFSFQTSPTLSGYTPRNKKLLNFPYKFLKVSNNEGQEIDLYPQKNNDDNTYKFVLSGNPLGDRNVQLHVKQYENCLNNTNYRLLLSDYPSCNWSYSAFYDFNARNKYSIVTNMAGNVINAGAGMIMSEANPMMAISNMVGSVGNALNQAAGYADTYERPNVKVEGGGSSGNIANNLKTFSFFEMCISKENAQRIDDYFDTYGYRIDTVKVPEMNTRSAWNYVELRNANITGNIPSKFLTIIKQTFERGVKLWHVNNIGRVKPSANR